MSFSEMMLPEFDQEMANTRKTLERVPEDKLAWKPHVKSTSLGGLATHLGNIPSWVKNTFEQDELDIAPAGAPPFRLEEAKSRSELLAAFDKNVADARAALKSASDEKWRERFVMNHLIHHRAQLGVYLRLLDVPVPSIYGPSADEGGF
ncbi:MAG: hypothetical protein AUJ04_05350 [Acidobacteria bacterium 13_1_40CM_3_55_6]|nr:MAG: hypothetical protein AUJ04_05350 [Acidobacteria bacterium 13_1_40CM_3_55_6]